MHILSRGKKCILNYLSSYLGMISYLRESLFYLAPIFAPLILLMLVKLFIPQMDLDETHFTFMIGVPMIRLFRQRNFPIMVFISSMMPRQPRQARASTSSASVDTQAPNVVERNIWISDQGKIIYTMRAPQGMGGLMHFHFGLRLPIVPDQAPRHFQPQNKSGCETLPALNFWTLLAARHFWQWTSTVLNLCGNNGRGTFQALRHVKL